MSETQRADKSGYASTAIKKTALIVGIVFLLVGVAGFIPGITQDVESMQFAGHESHAMLFGIFQVSILHNIVHLLFGVAGVAVAANSLASRLYLVIGGVIYIALWVYGIFVVEADEANIVPVNAADNWLHAGLAVGMILLGLFVGQDRSARRMGSRPVS